MLKLNPQLRAGCNEIVQTLERICRDCEQDEKYCTERIKVLQQTPTDRSDFVRYTEPPKADPINLVEAASILGLSPAMTAEGPSLDPSEPELLLEPTENTPLMNGFQQVRSDALGSEPATPLGLTFLGRLWHGITAVFCCFGRGR